MLAEDGQDVDLSASFERMPRDHATAASGTCRRASACTELRCTSSEPERRCLRSTCARRRFFDSTALAELIAFYKRLTGAGRRLEALVGDSNMRRLLELTSLDDLLGVSLERASLSFASISLALCHPDRSRSSLERGADFGKAALYSLDRLDDARARSFRARE